MDMLQTDAQYTAVSSPAPSQSSAILCQARTHLGEQELTPCIKLHDAVHIGPIATGTCGDEQGLVCNVT